MKKYILNALPFLHLQQDFPHVVTVFLKLTTIKEWT